VVELNRKESDPVELLLDSKLLARGEVVIVEGNYGFRVLEVVTPRERLQAAAR
jgi:flagellar motor switch protein FliN/FliY